MKIIKKLSYLMIMFVKKIRDKLLNTSFKVGIKIVLLFILVKVFIKHRKTLNCSHYCIYEFPSSRERNMISSELGVDKEQFKKATKKPFSFLYVDKPRKRVKRNFTGEL